MVFSSPRALCCYGELSPTWGQDRVNVPMGLLKLIFLKALIGGCSLQILKTLVQDVLTDA